MSESKCCIECGKEYFKKPDESLRSFRLRKYCSRECFLKHYNKVPALRVCPDCGKEFMRKSYQTYCPECHAKRYLLREKVKRVFTCLWCKKEGELKGYNPRFCCAEERGLYHQKRTAISNLYPWKEDEISRDAELERLNAEGCNYVLPTEKVIQ